LDRTPLFRLQRDLPQAEPIRLLAVVGPGDLMVNTPIDFLTNHLNVRLDLLHVLPGKPMPAIVPDHDVAFFAYSDPDAAMQQRLAGLYRAWPRPVLNDPRFLPGVARDVLSRSLAGVASIRSPETASVTRDVLQAHLTSGAPIVDFVATDIIFPCLIRPAGTHAGQGLTLAHGPDDLRSYLQGADAETFYISAFVDYADSRGLYCKSRVAFID